MPDPKPSRSSRSSSGNKPRPRTAAQAQASRRNGARSRGPVSATGKERSSRNAVQHGILARRLGLGQSTETQDFNYVRDQLVEEYDPQTITEWHAVEMLAFDYVQLGRVNQYKHAYALPDPAAVAPAEADPQAQVRRFRETLEMAEQLLEKLAAQGCMGLPPSDARRLAPVVARVLTGLEEDGRCFVRLEKRDPWQDEQLQRYQAIRPQELGLVRRAVEEIVSSITEEDARKDRVKDWVRQAEATMSGQSEYFVYDEPSVHAALVDGRAMAQELRPRWIGVLQMTVAKLSADLAWALDRQQRGSTPSAAHPSSVTRSLEGLEKVQRYETRARRQIEQTIKFLEKRRSGSKKPSDDPEAQDEK